MLAYSNFKTTLIEAILGMFESPGNILPVTLNNLILKHSNLRARVIKLIIQY
uniref:Uncharacterized protein n=1 Tax=viral metagenome TaxID=1070528 RepID=A0A6C0C9G5_9ZZZZ